MLEEGSRVRAFYALSHLVVDIGSEVVEAHSKSFVFVIWN
jgi:hypothetical protein